MKKIGILTAGGDCPGLNAAIRGVVKAAKELYDIETIGFYYGFKGLIENNFRPIEGTSGLLTRGGTILKTSREKPFKGVDKEEKLKAIYDNYHRNNLDCLVILGGNGTYKTAYNLQKKLGLNVLTLPKTIDNDIYGTDICFGFSSAVDIATEAIDRIHTTASSHNRAMVVEVMGHRAGWIGLYAGVASGSDVILIPEIPFSFEKVCDALESRSIDNKDSTIIVIAEGAISSDEINLSKEEIDQKRKFRSIGQRVANKLEILTGMESRLTVLGHVQRGGSPNARDRLLATNLGTYVAHLIHKEICGQMVSLKKGKAEAIPLADVAGKLKIVQKKDPILLAARSIGICMGD